MVLVFASSCSLTNCFSYKCSIHKLYKLNTFCWQNIYGINHLKTKHIPSIFSFFQETAYFCRSFMAKFRVCPWKTCWVVTDSPIMFHSFRQHNRMGLLTAPSPQKQRSAEKHLKKKPQHFRFIHCRIILVTIVHQRTKVNTNGTIGHKRENSYKWMQLKTKWQSCTKICVCSGEAAQLIGAAPHPQFQFSRDC